MFKVKTSEYDEVECYKARLVAQGFTQVKEQTMMKHSVLLFKWSHCKCWLLPKSMQRGLKFHQVDVRNYCFYQWNP